MKAAQAKKPVRDTIRDTLTPSRVGVLSWAFAAILMGTMGLASYKFGTASFTSSATAQRLAGLTLPPVGDVNSTASIRRSANIEVMNLPEAAANRQSALEQSQITVLQEQIAGLRRRISVLSEQNDGYSRRLASLETGTRLPDTAGTSETAPSRQTANPAFLDSSGAPDLADGYPVKRPMAPLPKPVQMADAGPKPQTQPVTSPGQSDTWSERRPASRRITIHTKQGIPEFLPSPINQAPVKIVQLPPADDTSSIVTGSIPDGRSSLPGGAFDSTPTGTAARPKIIEPSEGAGILRGGGQSNLKRSDFGAIVGHYASLAEAANAWSIFREQNEERMRDLRPLIKSSDARDGVSLLVGPFGNAADAAAACYYLLNVTDLCQPALFAGTPMVTASEFPKTAF